MNKRVGIITLYYNNYNYGGLLQSFALCKYLNTLGFEAEQISYDRMTENKVFENYDKSSFYDKLFKDPKRTVHKIMNSLYKYSHKNEISKIKKELLVRHEKMKDYELSIAHSEVFQNQNLSQTNQLYDFFICGSDQIWNPAYLRDSYFLTFVQNDKKKIAYAPSMGKSVFTEDELTYFKNKVPSLDAISVRETDGKHVLEKLIDKKVQVVVDPTLLLSKAIWEQEMKPYQLDKKYIFCYFLGKNAEHRKSVEKFAATKGLKIATISHAAYGIDKVDIHFGDYQLYDVDPSEFIYLINKAEYVFTDSFHATVFSILFQKQFIVFKREQKANDMISRIMTLLESVGLQSQYIDAGQLLNGFHFPEIDYSCSAGSLAQQIQESKDYLLRNLQ